MATLHDRDRDISEYRAREHNTEDREISLGTGTILGIFFALALLCAIFFGFGYSMGRKSVQTGLAAATPQTTNASIANEIFTSFKPSAGKAGGSSVHPTPPAKPAAPDDASNTTNDPDGEIVTTPVTSPAGTSATVKFGIRSASSNPPAQPASQPAAVSMPAISADGTAMVQVAAVSHQEDADTLISALKKKGYAVFVRQEPQDHLRHVQIGPFATRKDADAMRLHLLADGYNAIVK